MTRKRIYLDNRSEKEFHVYGILFAGSVGSVDKVSRLCCWLLLDGHISQVRDYFTLAMLNILCTTLLPNFYPANLQHSSYKHL